jgi:Tol biopolymer transport system component
MSFATIAARPRALGSLLAVAGTFACTAIAGIPAHAAAEESPLPPSAPGRLAYTSVETWEVGTTVTRGVSTIGLDGTDQRSLTTVPEGQYGSDWWPHWSPDGRWLAYDQNRDTSRAVVIPRDGGEQTVLDEHGHNPVWSPDGTRIAWLRATPTDSETGDSFALVVTPVFTSGDALILGPGEVVIPIDGAVGAIEFSPDGSTLLFVRRNPDAYGYGYGDLWTVHAAGGTPKQLTSGVPIDLGFRLYHWSPDGNQVAFMGGTADTPQLSILHVVNADGSDQHRLVPAWFIGNSGEALAWAPDGSYLAELTGGNFDGAQLWNLDGTSRGRVGANFFSGLIQGLIFAPDGASLYTVGSMYDAATNTFDQELYQLPVDGSTPLKLTTDGSVYGGTLEAVDPGRALREFGSDSSGTSVALSRANTPAASTVVIARSDVYADAIAAGPLAKREEAPVLLTSPSNLSTRVRQELRRLGTTRALVIGAVSPSVVNSLSTLGVTVQHVGNTTGRFAVAAGIARKLGGTHINIVPSSTNRSDGWRVGLAAAGYTARTRRPTLYVQSNSIPDATRATIRRLGVTAVTAFGNTDELSVDVVRSLRRMGLTVKRISAPNPYALSASLANRALSHGASGYHPLIASGSSWPSSLAAGATAGVTNTILVLVDGRDIRKSPDTMQWLRDHRSVISTSPIAGGVSALRPRAETQIEHRI